MVNRMNKLCLVTPNMERGGMQRVLSLIANYAVNERGIKVSIICLKDDVIEYDLDNKIRIFTPPFPYKQGLINKVKTFMFLLYCLFKIKPRRVLSCNEVYNPFAILACRLLNRKIIISDRSNPFKELRKNVQRFRKVCYPLAHGIIAQTQTAKEVALGKGYNKNIVVIPNPLRYINDDYPKLNEKVIITVGRLIKTKNIDELIEIFKELDESRDWELHILGDGLERENLEGIAQTLNNRIKFFGQVKDVDFYLSKASIFAFTSVSEGFPNALSEAIAYPLPVIAYDCPVGPSDMIENGKNGFLIPLSDKEMFKTQLKRLMNSKELRQQMTYDFNNYRKRYSHKQIIKEYLDFIGV